MNYNQINPYQKLSSLVNRWQQMVSNKYIMHKDKDYDPMLLQNTLLNQLAAYSHVESTLMATSFNWNERFGPIKLLELIHLCVPSQ